MPSCHEWLRSCHCSLAWHLFHHRRLGYLVSAQVREDDAQFYQALADRHSDESLPTLWKSLKPLLPRQAAKRRNNIRCVGPATSDIVSHFDELEAGEVVSYSQLLSDCHRRQQSCLHDVPVVVPLRDLPSNVDIALLCRRTKQGKAPGLDDVTATTLQQCLLPFADAAHLLFLKAFLQGAEPLQWKGGKVHVIPKKSNVLRADAMRGIMLLTGLGKMYHAMLRKMMIDWASHWKIPAQLGGFQRQQTSFATHLLRTFCVLAEAAHLSCGVIFFDVRAAFHSMLREHTFGGSYFPQRLREVLEGAGLDVAQLQDDIVPHGAPFQKHPNICLQRAVQDAHNSTWYVVDGNPDCHQTHRGSRPGSPLADIYAYNVAMTSVLRDIEAVLWTNPALCAAAAQLPVFPPLTTWVDDLAIPVPSVSASALDSQVLFVLKTVDDTMRSYGLELNMQPGKTELVCQYRGTGSTTCRHKRFVEYAGQLPLPCGRSLRVVAQYQHLGTAFHQSLSMRNELRGRLGKASAAYRQLSKLVFGNRKLRPTVRLQLLESLVLSILFHGAGTWPLLNSRLYAKLSHAIVGWQRRIVNEGFWSSTRLPDAEFQAKWHLMPLSTRLAKHRLLYGFQMIAHAPQDLITCISAEDDLGQASSWCSAFRHALSWLHLHDPASVSLDDTSSVQGLFQWISQNKETGPKLVRRLVRRAAHQDFLAFGMKSKIVDLYNICRSKGVRFDDVPAEPLQGIRASYQCHVCTSCFSTPQGLQAHQWRKHQLFSEERRYIYDATCRACNRCFWTTQRLQQHLRWSRRHLHGCFNVLQRYFTPLSVPASCPLPDFAIGLHRLPASVVSGPLPDAMPTAWECQQSVLRQSLRDQWSRFGFPDTLSPAVTDLVSRTLLDVTTAWTQSVDPEHVCIDDVLFQWLSPLSELSDMPDADEHQVTWALLEWGQRCLPDLIDTIEDPDLQICLDHAFHEITKMFNMWDMLMQFDKLDRAVEPGVSVFLPDPAPDRRQFHDHEPHSRLYHDPDQLLRHFVPPVLGWPRQPGVPLVVGFHEKPTLFVLHMFSGRRRAADCHDWIERLAAEYFPHLHVVAVSMDTAVHGQLGDLLSGPNFDRLVALADGSFFGLNLIGPPCETWTAARHIVCHELLRRGPRPLRSSARPWGLLELSLRELHQVGTGSHLMLNSLAIELRVCFGGGGSVMEHPSIPDNEEFASIWRTPQHRHLVMKAPEAQLVYIEQWRYGAESVKPTILRGLGLPRLARHLHSCRCPGMVRPTKVLAGFDHAQQRFRTSAAKEYPAGLSEGIVRSAFLSLQERMRCHPPQTVQWNDFASGDREWVQSLIALGSSFSTGTFLPDYQPTTFV